MRARGRVDDQALAERARHGDREAFTDLFERHAPAAWRLALAVTREVPAAAAAVVDAAAHVLGRSDLNDVDRSAPVSQQLLQATRAAALSIDAATTRAFERRMPELGIFGTRATADDVTVTAFEALPERARSVLWLLAVEGVPAASAATILGVHPSDVDSLATRARAALDQHLTDGHVRRADGDACQHATARLTRYVADDLNERDTVRVRRHLDRCEACRQRLDAVDDVSPRLHRTVPQLPYTLQDLAIEAWQAQCTTPGPLGLRLPSGAPAPAWAERALAGATAAVVAFGITAAVALGARRGDDTIVRESAAEQPLGAADGESALGGELPGEEGIEEPTDGTESPADPPADAGPTAPAAPASGAPSPVPRRSSGPTPAAPVTPTRPPAPAQPPASPPTTTPPGDPVTGIVDTVTDVLDPLGLCTGVAPVDGLTGCDAGATSSTPLGI